MGLLALYFLLSIMAEIESQSSLAPIDSISDNSGSNLTDITDTEANSSQAPPSKRRKTSKRRHTVWQYARKPIPGKEPLRAKSGKDNRQIWYCQYQQCRKYSTLSTAGAKNHMLSFHSVNCVPIEPSNLRKKIQQDLASCISKQEQDRHQKEDILVKEGLRRAANPAAIQQSLLRLIVHHNLPLSTVEWPELHTLINSINYLASNCI